MIKKNVIVFGESGSGKSSVINLLLGEDEAPVSNSAIGCTFEFQKYETERLVLYDTVGLSEGSQGRVTAKEAIGLMVKLLKQILMDGINLLVLVIRKDRITQTQEDNYRLLYNGICNSEVPIMLMITWCEFDDKNSWWVENEKIFDEYNMKFEGVVSGCTIDMKQLDNETSKFYKESREKTKDDLEQAIMQHALKDIWKTPEKFRTWIFRILKSIGRSLCKWFKHDMSGFSIPSLAKILISLGLSLDESTEISQEVYETFQEALP